MPTGAMVVDAPVVGTRPASKLSQHESSVADRRQLTKTPVQSMRPACNEPIAGRMHVTGVPLTRAPVSFASPALAELDAGRAAETGSNDKVNVGLVSLTGVT